MKRDMDLIRAILLAVEEWPARGGDQGFESLDRPGDVIAYHVSQAIKAGLLEGKVHVTSEGDVYFIHGLSPAGHDFLDDARTQFIWDEVKEEMKAKGVVGASIDVVKRMLDKAVRKRLEE